MKALWENTEVFIQEENNVLRLTEKTLQDFVLRSYNFGFTACGPAGLVGTG